jgi:lipopolysaccharide assembly protein A
MGVVMRYIQAFGLLAFLVAVGIFAAQNTGVITVNFLNWNLSQPVALVTVAVYVLGMLSGWTVLALMRGSFRQVTRPSAL